MQQNQELLGIDVSHYQGDIQWSTVKNHPIITFALAKATEGATWQDPAFNSNFQAIRQAEMTPGVTIFSEGIQRHKRRQRIFSPPYRPSSLRLLLICLLSIWSK